MRPRSVVVDQVNLVVPRHDLLVRSAEARVHVPGHLAFTDDDAKALPAQWTTDDVLVPRGILLCDPAEDTARRDSRPWGQRREPRCPVPEAPFIGPVRTENKTYRQRFHLSQRDF